MILTHSFPYDYDQYEDYSSYAPPTSTADHRSPLSSPSPCCRRAGASSSNNRNKAAAWYRMLAAEEARRRAAIDHQYRLTELQEQQARLRQQEQAKMRQLKQFVLQEENSRRAYEAAKLRRMAAEAELNKNKKPDRQTTRRQIEDEQEDGAQQKPSLLLVRGRDGRLYLVESERPQQRSRQPTNTEKPPLQAPILPLSQPDFAMRSFLEKKEKHAPEETPAQRGESRADEDTLENFFASLFGVGTTPNATSNTAEETQNEKPTMTASPFGSAADRNVEKLIAAALGTTESYQKAAMAVSNTLNNSENEKGFVENMLKAVLFGNFNGKEQENAQHFATPEEKSHKIPQQQEKEGYPEEEEPILRWVLGPGGGLYPVQMDTRATPADTKQTRKEAGEVTNFGRKDMTSCSAAVKIPVVPKTTTIEKMGSTRKLKDQNKKTKKTEIVIEDAYDSESEEGEHHYVWWRNPPSTLGEWMEPVHEA